MGETRVDHVKMQHIRRQEDIKETGEWTHEGKGQPRFAIDTQSDCTNSKKRSLLKGEVVLEMRVKMERLTLWKKKDQPREEKREEKKEKKREEMVYK
jgi:hypothetical protein